MKRFFLSMLTAVMAISMVSCEYDDSAVWDEINSLNDRVATLEQLCNQMNTNISSLQSLVNALQQNDYITAVVPITEGSKTIGYTITFAKGDPITIYHGQDGKDGANGKDGADGKDGYTPTIGVAKADDGVYYWTLDGEWLTDAEGNKIQANGKDGADGEDGEGGNGSMPELKIQGGYWYVSYDGGENWERLGRATGYDGTNGKDGDSFFEDVIVDDEYVTFILDDGTTFVVPRATGQESLIALKAVAKSGGEITLTGDVTLDGTLEIAAGKTVTINLDGYNIINASGVAIKNNGTLTIRGEGTISATKDDAINNTGTLNIMDDETTISGQGGITSTAGKILINGGDFTATSDYNAGTYNHILWAANTQVIINGGNFDATIGGTTNAMFNAAGGSDITINGGTFKNVSGTIPQFPPYIFTYENSGKLTINDGEFYGGWRFNNQATTDIYGGDFTIKIDGQSFQAGNPHVLTIYNGTFNEWKPTANQLGTDYKNIEVSGVAYIVPSYINSVSPVSSMDQLKNLDVTGAMVILTSNIDFGGASMNQPIEMWENSIFDGNGYTISNVVAVEQGGYATSLFRGDANGGNKIIKNLIIDGIKSEGNMFAAAIWSDLQNSANLTIENVHIYNAEIESAGTIGGFVGFTATGTNVTIKNSSINDSELIGGEEDKKRGVVVGRAYGNVVTCENVSVSNVKVNDVAVTSSSTLVGDKGYSGTIKVE